jgi:hypothetical protein
MFDEEQIRSLSKLPALPQSFSLRIMIALIMESDDDDDDESGVFSPAAAAAIVGQLVQQGLHARYEGIAILVHTSPLPSGFQCSRICEVVPTGYNNLEQQYTSEIFSLSNT